MNGAILARVDADLGQPQALGIEQRDAQVVLVNDQYYLSVALFNAKSLALAQVCVYSREDGAVHFHERRFSPWKLSLPPNILESQAAYRSPGFSLRFQTALRMRSRE